LTFTDSISELTDQTVALFSILEVNNHVPEFESQNTYDIICFPDFIYLESPVSIPVVQFQAFDNDKNDEIHYSISSQDFTIDEFTGQVYYNSEQYLSEEISAVIQVQHLSYDPANLDFIIKSSFPVFSK
jgi:hypothetical protein